MNELYQVRLPYGTFGVECENDKVVKSAPMGKWMLGKHIHYITGWARRKGGTVLKVKYE